MARYNQLGQWRPFITGGDQAFAESAAWQLAGQDEEVFSALFYVFYTQGKVLEFVVKTSVELPVQEAYLLNKRIHLWKCPRAYPLQTDIVYDGSWYLSGPSANEIQEGLVVIPQTLNRLAFAFRSPIQWRPKYNQFFRETKSFAKPSEDDIPLLDQFLRRLEDDEEQAIIDAAIDWYNRARGATNVFTRFLGYYIALESTALSITEGSALFGLNLPRSTKAERKAARISCIRNLHEEIYSGDPVKFATSAYFNCIGSIKSQVERVTSAVFGEGSNACMAVIGKVEGRKNLADLRSEIAHGQITMSNSSHRSDVASRVGEIADISGQFITRLLLRLRPDEPVPRWSNRYIAGLPADDPRHVWMADPLFIASKSWAIRPEWCD